MALSDADFAFALRNLDALAPGDKQHILKLLEERERAERVQEARDHFLPFVKMMWPEFIPGAHHTIMAEAFEEVIAGKCDRLIINMAPRFSKSELASWLLPAWFLGKFPNRKIIQASNNEGLAAGFGRRVRNLIAGEYDIDDVDIDEEHKYAPPSISYSELFPDIKLAKDSKAAALWHTNRRGEYFAIGVNGTVTGRGGNIVVIDDPHSDQEAKQAEANPDIFDKVYDWYTSGPRQRLQPEGAIIIVATRWSKRDLTGQVLKKMAARSEDDFGDRWKVINLPAILDEGEPTERSMWPAYWKLRTLQNTRAELPVAKWQSQYQQNPVSEGAAILKRENWKKWGVDTSLDITEHRSSCPGPHLAKAWAAGEPPACDYIIQSWDTAILKTQRADYSAMTTWGVFKAEDPKTGKSIDNLILLSAFKARMEFPELKRKVKQFHDEDQPDTLLIENKGSGSSLIQELRAMGTPVEDFSFGRGKARGTGLGNDKIARANMITDIFASGYVWAPEMRFAEEVIEECAEFPAGSHDDYVDSTVQAMLRFRTGGFIRTANDEEEDETVRRFRRKRYY